MIGFHLVSATIGPALVPELAKRYWIGNDSDSLQAFYTYYLLITHLRHDNERVVQCQNTSAGKCIFKSFVPQPNMRPPPQQVLAVAVAS